MKEATTAHHVAKVEGSLALVDEAKVELEAISAPVDVVKLMSG